MKNPKPMVVEYQILLYIEDSKVDKNGQSIHLGGEPSYRVGHINEIKASHTRICCDDMDKHIKLGLVGFGTRPEETFHNKVAEVFIRVKGDSALDIAIPYCPWCTQPVLTLEV